MGNTHQKQDPNSNRMLSSGFFLAWNRSPPNKRKDDVLFLVVFPENVRSFGRIYTSNKSETFLITPVFLLAADNWPAVRAAGPDLSSSCRNMRFFRYYINRPSAYSWLLGNLECFLAILQCFKFFAVVVPITVANRSKQPHCGVAAPPPDHPPRTVE